MFLNFSRKNAHQVSIFITTLICLFSCSKPVSSDDSTSAYKIVKDTIVSHGVVVSAHPLASLAGREILQKGGNAVDAAITTQLALAVVYPNAGNLGGGGFMVAHLSSGENMALDYREKAPSAAHRDMYLDENGDPIPRLSLDGHQAAGVPGSVAGLFAAHQYARLDFSTLIEPAIKLAEEGYAITEREATALNKYRDAFEAQSTRPTAFVKDQPWQAGDVLKQPELANTLKRIKENGAAGFYEGPTADSIVAEMRRGKGLISLEDLKNYNAQFRDPEEFNYRGYHIITMPLPSAGGVSLHQLLSMTEPYPLAEWGFHDPKSVQLMIETERRAYADRAAYLGDPDFIDAPTKELTDSAYLISRMESFTPGKASSSQDIQAGIAQAPESEETTHLSILDEEGNAVSVTTTLNGSYGSKTVVGGAGFLLNNEMDDFSKKPGEPNMYGLVGGEANAIEGNKRMLSSMTPTVVLKEDKPYAVLGTPGGSTIITSVYQTIVNLIDFNLSTSEAVNQPKFHHQWLPDVVFAEETFPERTKNALEEMGYTFESRKSIGRTEVVRVKESGELEASADTRGDDSLAGY